MLARLVDMGQMSTPRNVVAGLALAALVTAGCAAITPAGPPSDAAPSGSASAIEPSETQRPASGPAEPIPDAPLPSPNAVGDPVEIRGATIVYGGLEVEGQQLVARFTVLDGAVTEPLRLLLPDATTVEVHRTGSELVSDAFGAADSPPSSRSTMTLMAGTSLVQFTVGSVR